jgi:hypothetical protein
MWPVIKELTKKTTLKHRLVIISHGIFNSRFFNPRNTNDHVFWQLGASCQLPSLLLSIKICFFLASRNAKNSGISKMNHWIYSHIFGLMN